MDGDVVQDLNRARKDADHSLETHSRCGDFSLNSVELFLGFFLLLSIAPDLPHQAAHGQDKSWGCRNPGEQRCATGDPRAPAASAPAKQR